jgi:predicted TIM-barrel fold metal-dependent hydrolase
MTTSRIISADSHMMEPPDLWTTRLDASMRERAPRVVKQQGKTGEVFVGPGMRPFPVAGGFAAGRSGEELKNFMERARGYEDARPSGWDPVERLKDQDIDGVSAEVLYTTLGMSLFGMEEPELQDACFRTYNGWLAEFCAYDPKRLHGIALISLKDIARGTAELERAARIGLKGAMIWGAPSPDKPYWHHMYDPFWAAAQELQMPLSLHLGTSGSKPPRAKDPQAPRWVDQPFARGYMKVIHEVQRSFTDIIYSGVLMRFPRLKVVSAENDSGWIAHYMYRLDHAFEKWGASMTEPLDMKPSEYIRRQMWVTFQDDPIGPMTWKFFGEDNYMWASDFPHTDSTWPHSRTVIEKDFEGVPETVKRKITCDNAAKLYRIELN